MAIEQPGGSAGERAPGNEDGEQAERPGPEPAAGLRERMAAELPAALLAHIDRVVVIARELAALHALPDARVALAAQGHDLLRAKEPAELLRRAEQRGMPILPIERAHPLLLHGPLGALELAERLDVADAEVLAAIHWHTTGHPRYPPWAWAMFVADKVEPEKARSWPALEGVAAIARRPGPTALRDAAAAYLRLSLARQRDGRERRHPLAEETLAHLEAKARR